MPDLPPCATNGKSEQPRLIVTTSWDDGHPSDLRVATLLEKYGVAGTFYVPSRNLEGRPVMQSRDIAALGQRFEIGGHTQDHVCLTGMPPLRATNQILANKVWLENVTGREVTGFAYVRGVHNGRVRKLVQHSGYRYARTITPFKSSPRSDPFRLPTTIQYFPHGNATYVRNYMRRGPTIGSGSILSAVLSESGLVRRCLKAAEACAASGGYFHLWGHSWEIEELDLWQDFEQLLADLCRMTPRFTTNAGCAPGLPPSAKPQAAVPAAGGIDANHHGMSSYCPYGALAVTRVAARTATIHPRSGSASIPRTLLSECC